VCLHVQHFTTTDTDSYFVKLANILELRVTNTIGMSEFTQTAKHDLLINTILTHHHTLISALQISTVHFY